MLGITDDDIAVQTAARRPATFDARAPRLYDREEVVHDSVGDRFVENAFVAERLQIHFQTLQLDANFVGHVAENDRAVVGLVRFGTHRREFGTMMFDGKVSRRAGVIENLEDLAEFLGIAQFL